MELPINQIINGDCLEVLRTFPDESIDCIITSPPYWGLRQYLFDNATIRTEMFSNKINKWYKK